MRIITIICIFFTSLPSYSSETESIVLHEDINVDTKFLNLLEEDINSQKVTEDNLEINNNTENKDNSSDDQILEITNEDIEQLQIDDESYWNKINIDQFKQYLNNLQVINSDILRKEIFISLENIKLDYSEKKNKEIFYNIVNYFYTTGNITKAYNFLQKKDFDDDKYQSFYKTIEINYFLISKQLDILCDYRNDLPQNIKFKDFLIEKVDVFCLVLEGNLSQAHLLNSIIVETEIDLDENFQQLYLLISNQKDEYDENKINFAQIKSSDLLFLYSSMAIMGEYTLNEEFLEFDPNNLSIPILMNKQSPIQLRIKAANKSYFNNIISIDSLAALYQSVDFNSNQLDNPEETLQSLSSNIEMVMAFYYQFINVQIFPSERIEALVNFWNFAKENNLEKIAYSLSYKIIQSFEISSEFLDYSPQIATSYIYNNDFDNALVWLNFYENSKGTDDKSAYVNILLNLYSSKDIELIIQTINLDFDKFSKTNEPIYEELMFIFLSLIEKDNEKNLNENFDNIFDQRLMPSLFIIRNINQAIENNNNNKFLLNSTISMKDKHWIEIHPHHLKLIISGYQTYKDGSLMKDIILEIFENYKVL